MIVALLALIVSIEQMRVMPSQSQIISADPAV
jgi:hypothetical protein